ncbi:MAG: Acetyl-coenzyme A carboxylase carboxyl transferase subunit beta [Acetothermia bacterium 64_32]|nr:MAG: Acetyl-coenzyme A carboxylase carboxyl transferase subunit beta [Acetothermia bacterium 64_32]HAF71168.1 acetyl-CoA carboxylase, carboxyltransferase subunit beta [Candidatus Acetothermia bacterium]
MPIRRDDRDRYVEVELRRGEEPLWLRCGSCGELVFRRKLQENSYICPRCGAYFFLTAEERIAALVDEGSFEDLTLPLESDDPLSFSDRKPYADRLKEARGSTGLSDAVVVGRGRIEGRKVILAVMDFRFIGGSMGIVAGEQLAFAMERAVEERVPFLFVVASGGARVQEGVLSLLQMAKTVAARERLAEAGVPYIAVLTYPSTGGVMASLASLADVTLAEQGALIGFAGPRVIQQTTGEKPPPGFQRARYALEHGLVDGVVPREGLRQELARLLRVLEGVPSG